MIISLRPEHIDQVAELHLLAWQKAFKGILSDGFLNSLTTEDFAEGWKGIMGRKERKNLISLNEEEKVTGFVSFGPPYDPQEKLSHEIYGIYVHPDYWGQKVGYELMNAAIERLEKKKNYKGALLWVMKDNDQSRIFYERFGFRSSEEIRISARGDDEFEEVKYEYLTKLGDT